MTLGSPRFLIIESSSTLEIVRADPHDEVSSYAFPQD